MCLMRAWIIINNNNNVFHSVFSSTFSTFIETSDRLTTLHFYCISLIANICIIIESVFVLYFSSLILRFFFASFRLSGQKHHIEQHNNEIHFLLFFIFYSCASSFVYFFFFFVLNHYRSRCVSVCAHASMELPQEVSIVDCVCICVLLCAMSWVGVLWIPCTRNTATCNVCVVLIRILIV